MLSPAGCLTAPQGPVRHWWDWLRGRLFLALAFGEDGKGRDSLERDGHWDIAQSCSVVGRSSGSHSLAFTSWSLKLTHSTCRVVFPWPHVTEHWQQTHTEDKEIMSVMHMPLCKHTLQRNYCVMWGKGEKLNHSWWPDIGINGLIYASLKLALNCVFVCCM